MDYQAAKNYLLSKPEAVEDYPFGPQAAVFKVKQKMFAILMHREGVAQMNLKCEPHRAAALRDMYEAVIPGYHMNKLHWNTVILNNTIADSDVQKMIDHSYSLVVKGLRKVEKSALVLAYGETEIFKEL